VEDYNWAGKKSDTDLLREANSMLDMVKDMDADAVSVLCSITSKMDQPILTKTLIEQWLGTHHFTPEEASNLLSTGPREHVHPAIIKHLRLLAEQTTSRSYDLETVAQRIQMNFHDDEDEKVIANSSVEQYIQTLKSLDKEEFVDFVRLHLNWIRFGKHYPYKVAGRQKFVEACARIIEAEPESRLARILRRNVFNDATSDLRNNVEGADH
jgi:hypothetical protein